MTFIRRGRRLALATLCAIAMCASFAYAQQIWLGGGYNRYSARFATFEDFDGQWLYCRGFFGSAFGQGGWTTDYPGADNNFSVRLAELTKVPVRFDEDR